MPDSRWKLISIRTLCEEGEPRRKSRSNLWSIFLSTPSARRATIAAVLDDNALKERQGGQELSVAESSLLLYAAVEDLPARRPAGEGLNVDGREYIVNDWSEDMGIATVALGQTVTM